MTLTLTKMSGKYSDNEDITECLAIVKHFMEQRVLNSTSEDEDG
jgi:transcription elongation factor GreA-like protein